MRIKGEKMLTRIVIAYYLIINVVALVFYGVDKLKAIKNKWRIPEATLLGLAFFGGGLGALMGMQIFRHKTKHWSFRILVPLFLILHIVLVAYVKIKLG